MEAIKGQYVKVKEEVLGYYKSKGYIHNEEGYEVTSVEHVGVFIKEYGYIILHSDYEIVEDHEHTLTIIMCKMYGDYRCTCGCNKLLGNRFGMYCYGVGYADDEEGDTWRMFRPECWEEIKSMFPDQIYNSYKTNELA